MSQEVVPISTLTLSHVVSSQGRLSSKLCTLPICTPSSRSDLGLLERASRTEWGDTGSPEDVRWTLMSY